MCKSWRGIYSPREAEVVAIREALRWTKNHNLDKIHVETYAFLVVQGLKYGEEASSFGLILLDVKDMLSQLPRSNISFVK